jgi:hypothetical protein
LEEADSYHKTNDDTLVENPLPAASKEPLPMAITSSVQEITPSPKSGLTTRETPGTRIGTNTSARKRPASQPKRAPKNKKWQTSFDSSTVGTSPPLWSIPAGLDLHQPNKEYEALSLRALDIYKEKTSSFGNEFSQNHCTKNVPIPLPYGHIADPRYLGFMDAYATSSLFPGVPLHPPGSYYQQPNGMAFCPTMLKQPVAPGPPVHVNAPLPPYPSTHYPIGALDLLTQAATVHPSRPHQEQGSQDANADTLRRFFMPNGDYHR